jgi:hypothetical protein
LNKLYPVGLRAFPMLLKLLLLFFLGSYSLNIVGDYGVKMALLTILTTFFGLETFNITNKVFISDNDYFKKSYTSYLTLSSLLFLTCILLLFLCSIIFRFDTVFYYGICAIAFIEYLLMEYYRIIMISKSTIYINKFYFFKNGLWPIAFALTIYLSQSLGKAFLSYFAVQFTIVIFLFFKHFNILKKFKTPKITYIDVSFLVYALRAVILRSNQYMDRFSSSYFLGDKITGVLVLLTTLANFVGQIGEAIVVPVYYKQILKKCSNVLIKKYQFNLLKIGLLYSLVPLCTFYIYSYIKNIDLLIYQFDMILVLFLVIINLTALPFHHGLLSLKKHFPILKIASVNFILSLIIFNVFLYIFNDLRSLVVSMFLISLLMYTIKKRIFSNQII